MPQNKLEEYKKRLEEERAQLVAKIKSGKHEDFGSDVGPDEEADEAESFGTRIAINQGLRERVAEIDAALNRIHEGKYGSCSSCGKKLEDDILKISPTTSLCKDCKKKE